MEEQEPENYGQVRKDIMVFFRRYQTKKQQLPAFHIEDVLRDAGLVIDDVPMALREDDHSFLNLEDVVTMALAADRVQRAREKVREEAKRRELRRPRITVGFARPAIEPRDVAVEIADAPGRVDLARRQRRSTKEEVPEGIDWGRKVSTCFYYAMDEPAPVEPSPMDEANDDVLVWTKAVYDGLASSRNAQDALTLLLASPSSRRALDDALSLLVLNDEDSGLPLPLRIAAAPSKASTRIMHRCFFREGLFIAASPQWSPAVDSVVNRNDIVQRLLKWASTPRKEKVVHILAADLVARPSRCPDDEAVVTAVDVFVSDTDDVVLVGDSEALTREDLLRGGRFGFFDAEDLLSHHDGSDGWHEDGDLWKYREGTFEYRCRSRPADMASLRRALRPPMDSGSLDPPGSPIIIIDEDTSGGGGTTTATPDDDDDLTASSSDDEEEESATASSPGGSGSDAELLSTEE